MALDFDGTNLTEATYVAGSHAYSGCNLSIGGNYLFITTANATTASSNTWIRVYVWNEGAETFALKSSLTENIQGYYHCNVNYNNKYLALGSVVNTNYVKVVSTKLKRDSRNRCIT